MSRRIIKLGTWENKPMEWIVLKVEDFGTLVLSAKSIGQRAFDSNSSNNNWDTCTLRKFLNGEFFSNTFTSEEKKKIVNARLDKCKDNIFLPSEEEFKLLNQYGRDEYEDDCCNLFRKCALCCWTRTKNGSSIRHGYATKDCWCSHYPNYASYAVRPAMYIRESPVKKN